MGKVRAQVIGYVPSGEVDLKEVGRMLAYNRRHGVTSYQDYERIGTPEAYRMLEVARSIYHFDEATRLNDRDFQRELEGLEAERRAQWAADEAAGLDPAAEARRRALEFLAETRARREREERARAEAEERRRREEAERREWLDLLGDMADNLAFAASLREERPKPKDPGQEFRDAHQGMTPEEWYYWVERPENYR